MSRLSVHIDEESVFKALSTLDGIENGLPRAYAAALNKTTTGMKTDMSSLIREKYGHKSSAVKSRISTIKATFSNLKASTTSTGKSVPLTDIAGTRATASGVTVNVRKDTGSKRLKHAFIAPGRNSGKLLVFWRADPKKDSATIHKAGRKPLDQAWMMGQVSKETGLVWRYPIIALYAPHPESLYNTSENWPKLQTAADARLKANFAHEVEYVFNKYYGVW